MGWIAVTRVLAALASAVAAFAQAPRFEVASVKVLAEGSRTQIIPERSGGRFKWPTNLSFLLEYAYDVPDWRVLGLPQGNEAYAIDAAASPEAGLDQVRRMFQSLLADRFRLASHWTTREIDGFVLTVGKGGSKMMEAGDGAPPAAPPSMLRRYSPEALKAVLFRP